MQQQLVYACYLLFAYFPPCDDKCLCDHVVMFCEILSSLPEKRYAPT
jgi:hypothetical protein